MTAKLRVKAFKPARGALAVWRARSAFVVIGHFANDKAELFTRSSFDHLQFIQAHEFAFAVNTPNLLPPASDHLSILMKWCHYDKIYQGSTKRINDFFY